MASLQSMPAPMKRSALAIDTSGSTSPSHSNVDTGRSNQANSDDPASEELHRDFVVSPLTAQTPLRSHVPDATSSSGSTNPESLSTSSERIFQQLDSIRNLHQNILKDHAKLAGLDTLYQSERGQDGLEDGPGSTKGHDDPAGRKDRDKDRRGEDQGDEQTGAASYEQLAADFARRQDGVEGIMRQLSELSSALKELHAMPSPSLFPNLTVKSSVDQSKQSRHEGRQAAKDTESKSSNQTAGDTA